MLIKNIVLFVAVSYHSCYEKISICFDKISKWLQWVRDQTLTIS